MKPTSKTNAGMINVRLVAVVLILAMFAGALVSCNVNWLPYGADTSDVAGSSDAGTTPDATTPEATTPESTAPAVTEPTPDWKVETPMAGDVLLKEEFKYERPDFAKIESECKAIVAMVKEGKESEEAVKAKYDALEDIVYDAYTMSSINSARQSEDVTNTKYSDEDLWLTEQSANMTIWLVDLDISVYESKYSKAVLGDLTDAEVRYLMTMKKLSDDEYVALTTKDSELQNKYLSAEADVTFVEKDSGKTYHASDLDPADPNYKAYLSMWEDEYLKYVGDILAEMVTVRNKIAVKAGYANYADFSYDIIYERAYTPADAGVFASGVKNGYMKLLMSSGTYNFSQGEVNFINGVYSTGKFDVSKYFNLFYKRFYAISPKMAETLVDFVNEGNFTVGSEENRREGAYTTYLYSHETPIIFINKAGTLNDLQTFVHEFGHYYAMDTHGLDQTNNLDICEIHSQLNEVLFLPAWKEIVGSANGNAVEKYQMMMLAYAVLSGCQEDEFQRIIYAQPDKYHDAATYCELYAELNKAYGIYDDNTIWTQIHHTFTSPFYYISYAVSAVPVIEGYMISKEDYSKAVELYNKLIELSDDKISFVDLMTELGLTNPFTEGGSSAVAEKVYKRFHG